MQTQSSIADMLSRSAEAIAVARDDAVRRDKAARHAHYKDVPAGRDRHRMNLQVGDARLQAAQSDLLKPPLLGVAIARERCQGSRQAVRLGDADNEVAAQGVRER